MIYRLIGSVCVLTFSGLPMSLSRAADDIIIVDFTSNPLPFDWQVEGYAFGSRRPGPERQQAAKTTPNQRQYQTGKLVSPESTIKRGYLVIELRGTYHPEHCCVALFSRRRSTCASKAARLSSTACACINSSRSGMIGSPRRKYEEPYDTQETKLDLLCMAVSVPARMGTIGSFAP